jgi:iron complex outermembrane receptor protein
MPRTLRLLLLMLGCSGVVLHAQRPDSVQRLPDRPVTVTRVPSRLGPLASSVSIVDSSDVRRGHLATGLDEALGFVPGVVVSNRWNYSLDQRLTIRGFGARSAFGIRGVRILVDGVPQTLPDGQSQLSNLDLGLVRRIEVLRGVAGALHGNASGGVVAFETVAWPADRWHAAARVEGGGLGTSRMQVVGQARRGSLGGTVAVSRFLTDGFRQHSAAEQRRVSLGVEWLRSGTTRWSLRFAAADDPQAQNPGALTAAELAANPDSAAAANITRDADKRVSQQQLSVAFHHDEERLSVETVLYGLARALRNPLATPPPGLPGGTYIRIDRRAGGLRSTVSWKTRAPVITAGLDVQLLRDDRTNQQALGGEPTGVLLVSQVERVAEAGLFGGASLRRGPVNVDAVLRGDLTHYGVTDRLLTDGDASGRRTMSAVSGSAGVSWQAAAGVEAWSNMGTSFETPTTTELGNRPDGTGGFDDRLGPQHSLSTEVGVRAQRSRYRLEIVGYLTRTRDAIVPFREVSGRTYYRNAGQTRTRGAEATLTLPVVAQLHALATLTLTDARFASYRVTSGSTVDTLDGRRVPGIPLAVFRVGLRGDLGAGWWVDGEQALSSGQYADDDNLLRADGWGLGITTLRLGWHGHLGATAFEPYLGAANLLDRRYVGSVTVNGSGGRVFEPAAGRVVSVGFDIGLGGH